MAAEVSQILVPFGFTGFESEIYTFLLRESPATGYRVAQALGKAAANTYKAIESLQQKGAVLVEEGSSRLCRAVPSDELLSRLTRDFEWRRAEAELMLARLDSSAEDDRVYTLRSRSQVVERARHMLSAAHTVVLMNCSASVAHQLGDSLTAAAHRKDLRAFLSCPEELGIRGLHAAVTTGVGSLDEIRLVVDGLEHLSALFIRGREEVAQAIWSKSAYLSVCGHRGLAAELTELGLNPPVATSTPGYAKLIQNLTPT